MSILGTAAQVDMVPERKPGNITFRTTWALICWRYTQGAKALHQSRAIDPETVGTGSRNPWLLEARQLRYALAIRAVACAPYPDVLQLSAFARESDESNADALHLSVWDVRHRRRDSIRAVALGAHVLGLVDDHELRRLGLSEADIASGRVEQKLWTVRWLSTAEAAQRLGVGESRMRALADTLPNRQGPGRTAPRTWRACCVRAFRERRRCGVCAGAERPHEDDAT